MLKLDYQTLAGRLDGPFNLRASHIIILDWFEIPSDPLPSPPPRLRLRHRLVCDYIPDPYSVSINFFGSYASACCGYVRMQLSKCLDDDFCIAIRRLEPQPAITYQAKT